MLQWNKQLKDGSSMATAFSGVYSISFPQAPDSIYIGQSKDIPTRWMNHLSTANTGKLPRLPIYRAFAKYGIENAGFTILEECPEDELLARETYWDSHFKGLGYKMYNVLAGEMKANSEAMAVAKGGSAFHLKNWATGELERFASIREAARKTGYTVAMIHSLIKGKNYNGHNVFSVGSYTLPDCDRPPSLINKAKSKRGKVTLTKGDQVLVFDSQTQAAAFLGVDRSTVGQAIKHNHKCKGWSVTQEAE